MPITHCRTRPPLGRVRIDPVEVREIGPVLGGVDEGQRVVLGEIVRGGRSVTADDEQADQGGSEGGIGGPYGVTRSHDRDRGRGLAARRTIADEYAGTLTMRQVNPCSLRWQPARMELNNVQSGCTAAHPTAAAAAGLSDNLRR